MVAHGSFPLVRWRWCVGGQGNRRIVGEIDAPRVHPSFAPHISWPIGGDDQGDFTFAVQRRAEPVDHPVPVVIGGATAAIVSEGAGWNHRESS